MSGPFKLAILTAILAYTYYHFVGSQVGSGEVMIVETVSGRVKGVTGLSRDGREFFKWLHIPYAQPPVGPLRFASPKPVQKWEGVRDGSFYGPHCAQLEILNALFVGDEDCLHLNIFRPKVDKGLLPVLVYIHGGAFIAGGALDFGPIYFMDEDIILITINYRLGMLGFLSTGDSAIRGNMGLKDQVMGLRWIKENIKNFGGDPSNVVIMGESAGGASVHYLSLSNHTEGLFKKAISLSGVVNHWNYRPASQMREKAINFAKKLKCPDPHDSLKMVECLRNLGVQDLLHASYDDVKDSFAFNPAGKGEIPSPVIETIDDEDAFLVTSPYEIMRSGRTQKIPWMTGIVAQDGLISSAAFYREKNSLDIVEENLDEKIQQLMALNHFPRDEANDISQKIRQFYFTQNRGDLSQDDAIKRYTDFFTDVYFASGAMEAALIQRQFSPVFLYYYNRTGGPSFGHPMSDMGTNFNTQIEYGLMLTRKFLNQYLFGVAPRSLGICHMDELLMMFPMFNFLKVAKDDRNVDYIFSKEMTKLVADFVKDETSMKLRKVSWTPTPKEGKLEYFVIDELPQMMEEPDGAERQEFWRSLKFYERYAKIVEAGMGKFSKIKNN